jgi:hypothetical protein
MIDINKLNTYIDIVDNASEYVTLNTLENIFNKLNTITPEQLVEIRNYNAVLLQAESIEREQIKNNVSQCVTNQLEQYVSQL